MPWAGVGWQVLQYLEGFRRLGHLVFYLEDTQRWPYDPVQDTVCDDAGPAVSYVAALMERVGLEDAWAYRDVAADGRLHGASERELGRALSDADVLVNLSGVTVLRDEHLRIPVRVYLETDPVLPQIEVAQGREFTIDFLAAHTHHFSYGENFGAPDCLVPIERFEYGPTRPPIVLDWWASGAQELDGDRRPFTTIANWRQSSKDIEWNGELLRWSKHAEFERFIGLAERIRTPIELALAFPPEDSATVAQFQAAGWGIRPARPLSQDLDSYRDFVRGSRGEFSVAKAQNILLRSGWFSDRTACYLAAGKPAIVQDTGFDCALPTGEGLLKFSTIDEAVVAFEAVEADYARHALAAREIAAGHLRAEAVLSALLNEVTSSPVHASATSRTRAATTGPANCSSASARAARQ
jgi:hypothetical protein